MWEPQHNYAGYVGDNVASIEPHLKKCGSLFTVRVPGLVAVLQ
jgi:hypothetical protein